MSVWNFIPTREQLSLKRRSPALDWGLSGTAESTALGILLRRYFALVVASTGIWVLAMVVAGGLNTAGLLTKAETYSLANWAVSLVHIGPLVILCAWAIRRANDTGRSWTWLMPLWASLLLMPLSAGLQNLGVLNPMPGIWVASVVVAFFFGLGQIIWLVKAKGDTGENRYGPTPSPVSEPR